jgi:hypothetical protein
LPFPFKQLHTKQETMPGIKSAMLARDMRKALHALPADHVAKMDEETWSVNIATLEP